MEFEDGEDGFAAFSSTNTMDRVPCGICGRSFAPDVLARHTPICQKSAMKKRKVFDSTKMRAEGTEINTVKKTAASRRPQKAEIPKKSNWRQKHEEFIRSIRGAKEATDAIAQGKPLPPPPPPSINPDYVQCEYCDRRFNQTAAERHIPFCKEKNARIGGTPVKPGQANAAAKQAKRLQYQAPKLKRASPGTSTAGSAGGSRNTNYSNSRIAAPSRGGGAGQRTAVGTRNGSYGKSPVNSPTNEYSSGMGSALRTGRTGDTYDDARQFSAKQRSGMPRNKHPSNDSISKYGNYNYEDNTQDSYYGNRSYNPGNYGYHSSSNHHGYETYRPYSGNQSDSGDSSHGGGRVTSAGTTARFCHECGTKYPVPSAKFCCECGIKRISIR